MAIDPSNLTRRDLEKIERECFSILDELESHLNNLKEESDKQEKELRNTATRLGIDASVLIGSILLSPWTFGWSLIPALMSLGAFVWDARKLAIMAGAWQEQRRQVDHVLSTIKATNLRLDDIQKALAQRTE